MIVDLKQVTNETPLGLLSENSKSGDDEAKAGLTKATYHIDFNHIRTSDLVDINCNIYSIAVSIFYNILISF